ncbi:MAG: sugar ABC transporter ATP-binding protein [Lachnospiraceae bacterium]|nr:sugar ABC transporter ATP-binding protein [Lachnospiraceae bacterium]
MLKDEYALELKDIYKSFYQNQVLKGVSLNVEKGMIMGLLGGNGAGKSTLMKIVNGIYAKDSGAIFIGGKEIELHNAQDAKRQGIAMVYQELSLVPTLTVVQNLFLNAEPCNGLSIDEKMCLKQAKEAFEDFGINDIDPNAVAGDLPIGKKQLIEIIKAMLKNPQVLILDEPTASLTQYEIGLLFEFIRKLKERGIAIILISHHMKEIVEICDRAVILFNGTVALNAEVKSLTIPDMVEAMVGREVQEDYVKREKKADYNAEPLLCVKDLENSDGKLNGACFTIYPGEVVGIAGLMGSGRTELIKCIYGLMKPKKGSVTLRGKKITGQKPWVSVDTGVFMIPEDRRKSGIIDIHSVKMNLFLSAWKHFTKGGWIQDKKADEEAKKLIEKLDIKTTGIGQEVKNLSGGNQQKVVFGKSVFLHPDILMLDDPTVGVDVEAKDGICRIISAIADTGSGVLLVSSEFDHLARVCDRVLIMKQGRMVGELKRGKDKLSESSLLVAVQGA